MNLMGLDIGFSKVNDSTGIACLDSHGLTLGRAYADWESRKKVLPPDFKPEVIAVDGPIVPSPLVRRTVEETFSRGIFRNRCKPGLSDYGTGLQLRQATADVLPHLEALEPKTIVEAFPNLFLGVLLSDEVYLGAPELARGKRFDWLYDRVAEDAHLVSRLSDAANLPPVVLDAFRCEKDHELRAAIVCLILAGLTAVGNMEMVGDAEGGWFTLPPRSLWQDWAREGLDANLNISQPSIF